VVAGTLITVALGLYVPPTSRLVRWYFVRSWKAIHAVRPLGRSRRIRQLTQAYGTIVVASWRLVLGVYLLVALCLVVPVALSIGALVVSFHVLQPTT